MKSFWNPCSTSGCPINFPSGTKQTVWLNSMMSAALTLSSVCFGFGFPTALALYFPRPQFRRTLQDSRSRCPRHSARFRRRAQLPEQVGNALSGERVPGGEHLRLLALIHVRGPHLAHLFLESGGHGRLSGQPKQNELAGEINPVRR